MLTAIYCRVSTTDQNCEMQLRELRDYADRHNWTVYQEYIDVGWSGAKVERPAFKDMMKAARSGKFDILICWKLDRFMRSFVHCELSLQELKRAGVRFIVTTQGIDTDDSSPTAKYFRGMVALGAEFERDLARERSMAGILRYRRDFDAGRVGKEISSRSGKNLNIGRPRRIFDKEEAFKFRSEGLSLRRIARELGIGLGTVSRTLRGVPKPAKQDMEKAC